MTKLGLVQPRNIDPLFKTNMCTNNNPRSQERKKKNMHVKELRELDTKCVVQYILSFICETQNTGSLYHMGFNLGNPNTSSFSHRAFHLWNPKYWFPKLQALFGHLLPRDLGEEDYAGERNFQLVHA